MHTVWPPLLFAPFRSSLATAAQQAAAMPTQETQVYWYDVPTPKAPWRSPEELQRCVQESKELMAQQVQQRWHSEHDTNFAATHRSNRTPVLRPRSRLLAAARHRRALAAKRLEEPAVAQGVVPEPDATPLRVVNLIMEHLHQRPVLHAEAAEVVENVAQHFAVLTQPSQRAPANPFDDAGHNSPHRRRRRDTAVESLLSQLQQDEGPSGPSASQATAGVAGALSAALQDSLLLDALGAFCAARGLAFQRLTRAELRGMQYRVTSLEAVPHRRVVVLADRFDYSFVVLFGVERRKTPELFVRRALERADHKASWARRYARPAARLTQVFCMAPAPMPWRRVARNMSINALRDEFVVAVIEVRDDADADTVTEDERDAQDTAPPRKRQRATELLGAEDESVTTAGSRGRTSQGSVSDGGRDSASADLWPSSRGASRLRGGAAVDPAAPESSLDVRWLSRQPLFTRTATTANTVGTPLHGSWVGRGGEGTAAAASAAPDPLLSLPRADATTHRRGSRRLALWYRRLLRNDILNPFPRMQFLDQEEGEDA